VVAFYQLLQCNFSRLEVRLSGLVDVKKYLSLRGGGGVEKERNVSLMGRLDQGHFHPKLEVPGLTCLSRESNPGFRDVRRAIQTVC
jgi:hypothetical protein